MSETETRETCDTLVTRDGEDQPCERPAIGWRWYPGGDHEPGLWPACAMHENAGGSRMHAAEAEAARLRAVVEAVQALADMFRKMAEDRTRRGERVTGDEALAEALVFAGNAYRLAAAEVERALAPVSSSGEAESGEAAEPVGDRWDGTPLYSWPSCRHLTVNEPPRSCAVCEAVAPAPVSSGGQADGEDVRLRTDERDAIALAKHRTWHIGCEGRCGGTIDDWISVDRELVPAVERILTARLAARPVLSREALRERLDGHWPTFQDDGALRVVCDCGWTSKPDRSESGLASAQWRDHLADVLTAGGEQDG